MAFGAGNTNEIVQSPGFLRETEKENLYSEEPNRAQDKWVR